MICLTALCLRIFFIQPIEMSGTTYACMEISEDEEVATCLSCTMKFVVRDCDPNTGEADDVGYEDEYAVCSKNYLKKIYLLVFLEQCFPMCAQNILFSDLLCTAFESFWKHCFRGPSNFFMNYSVA